MIHTIILAALLYAIVRAALRRSPPDPMAGRLIHRSASVSAVRPQPATVAAPFTPPPFELQSVTAARYKAQRAAEGRRALMSYWPKDVPIPETMKLGD
jgi:hypothetical protein